MNFAKVQKILVRCKNLPSTKTIPVAFSPVSQKHAKVQQYPYTKVLWCQNMKNIEKYIEFLYPRATQPERGESNYHSDNNIKHLRIKEGMK